MPQSETRFRSMIVARLLHGGIGPLVLIDCSQASITPVETERAQPVHTDAGPADILVLDDVTPLYAQASAALDPCNASLTQRCDF